MRCVGGIWWCHQGDIDKVMFARQLDVINLFQKMEQSPNSNHLLLDPKFANYENFVKIINNLLSK